MSEPKWTPAPWTWGLNSDRNRLLIWSKPREWPIANLGGDAPYGEVSANACLIAAAPELYEAAQEGIARIRELVSQGSVDPSALDALAPLDAALAKARGEEADA